MKVEYSYHRGTHCMAIKGADFQNAIKNKRELYLLEVAVDGFCSRIGADTHFGEEVNSAIAHWAGKTSTVIYSIQERWIGDRCTHTWCEVYVQNGVELTEVVFSDDYGRHYILCGEEPDNE